MCIFGSRAETRGECNCGAGDRPYRARVLKETDEHGRRLVEVEIDGPLTTGEVAMLSIMLQDLTKEEGRRWSGRKS